MISTRIENTLMNDLHMGWEHVLFANWPVDPDAVAPHLPDDLSLDTHDGRAWLSVVPFTNVDVRPAWLPVGWGFALPELNLRTYVTHEEGPGVYFFNLDAHGILGVVGARLFHHLPYYYARMDLRERAGRIDFESRRRHPGARPVHFRATYEPIGEAFRSEPGSVEAFLTERDRYYTQSLDGALRYATVEHERWPLYRAKATFAENDLFAANGFDHPDSEPVFLYSPRVTTQASRSFRVD